jgi:hypothetical protein
MRRGKASNVYQQELSPKLFIPGFISWFILNAAHIQPKWRRRAGSETNLANGF